MSRRRGPGRSRLALGGSRRNRPTRKGKARASQRRARRRLRGGARIWIAAALLALGMGGGAWLAESKAPLRAGSELGVLDRVRELAHGVRDWSPRRVREWVARAPDGWLPGLSAQLRQERFWLRRVDFLGLQRLGAESLAARLELRPDLPLIDLDPAALCERLTSHPRVARCRAARLPPGRLIVQLKEREPIAVLAGTQLGVDEEGERFPLDPEERSALPLLEEAKGSALELARAAREREVALTRISRAKGGELRFWPRGTTLRVRGSGDAERLLAEWLAVERTGLARTHGAGEVDLRFRGRAVLRKLTQPKGGATHGPS